MANAERELRLIRNATFGVVVLIGAFGYVDGTIKSTNLASDIGQTRINPALNLEESEVRVDALSSQRAIEIGKALGSLTFALASSRIIYSSLRRRQNS